MADDSGPPSSSGTTIKFMADIKKDKDEREAAADAERASQEKILLRVTDRTATSIVMRVLGKTPPDEEKRQRLESQAAFSRSAKLLLRTLPESFESTGDTLLPADMEALHEKIVTNDSFSVELVNALKNYTDKFGRVYTTEQQYRNLTNLFAWCCETLPSKETDLQVDLWQQLAYAAPQFAWDRVRQEESPVQEGPSPIGRARAQALCRKGLFHERKSSGLSLGSSRRVTVAQALGQQCPVLFISSKSQLFWIRLFHEKLVESGRQNMLLLAQLLVDRVLNIMVDFGWSFAKARESLKYFATQYDIPAGDLNRLYRSLDIIYHSQSVRLPIASEDTLPLRIDSAKLNLRAAFSAAKPPEAVYFVEEFHVLVHPWLSCQHDTGTESVAKHASDNEVQTLPASDLVVELSALKGNCPIFSQSEEWVTQLRSPGYSVPEGQTFDPPEYSSHLHLTVFNGAIPVYVVYFVYYVKTKTFHLPCVLMVMTKSLFLNSALNLVDYLHYVVHAPQQQALDAQDRFDFATTPLEMIAQRPLPDLLHYLIDQLPPMIRDGRTIVRAQLPGSFQLLLHHPAVDDLPLCDLELRELFVLMEVDTILFLLAALCCQRLVVVYSKYLDRVSLVLEAGPALLYPLEYALPSLIFPDCGPISQLEGLLESPVAMLVGTTAKQIERIMRIPEDVVVLNLDDLKHNELEYIREMCEMPKPCVKAFKLGLHRILNPTGKRAPVYSRQSTPEKDPEFARLDFNYAVRYEFLKLFSTVLPQYRSHISFTASTEVFRWRSYLANLTELSTEVKMNHLDVARSGIFYDQLLNPNEAFLWRYFLQINRRPWPNPFDRLQVDHTIEFSSERKYKYYDVPPFPTEAVDYQELLEYEKDHIVKLTFMDGELLPEQLPPEAQKGVRIITDDREMEVKEEVIDFLDGFVQDLLTDRASLTELKALQFQEYFHNPNACFALARIINQKMLPETTTSGHHAVTDLRVSDIAWDCLDRVLHILFLASQENIERGFPVRVALGPAIELVRSGVLHAVYVKHDSPERHYDARLFISCAFEEESETGLFARYYFWKELMAVEMAQSRDPPLAPDRVIDRVIDFMVRLNVTHELMNDVIYSSATQYGVSEEDRTLLLKEAMHHAAGYALDCAVERELAHERRGEDPKGKDRISRRGMTLVEAKRPPSVVRQLRAESVDMAMRYPTPVLGRPPSKPGELPVSRKPAGISKEEVKTQQDRAQIHNQHFLIEVMIKTLRRRIVEEVEGYDLLASWQRGETIEEGWISRKGRTAAGAVLLAGGTVVGQDIATKFLNTFHTTEDFVTTPVERDKDNRTLLHVLAQLQDPVDVRGCDAMALLCRMLITEQELDRNAVDIPDDQGNTPLHYAVANRASVVAQALLRAGADLNVRNNQLQSPLGLIARLLERQDPRNPEAALLFRLLGGVCYPPSMSPDYIFLQCEIVGCDKKLKTCARHHCRNCGRRVCDYHTYRSKIVIPAFQENPDLVKQNKKLAGPLRVCIQCAEVLPH